MKQEVEERLKGILGDYEREKENLGSSPPESYSDSYVDRIMVLDKMIAILKRLLGIK